MPPLRKALIEPAWAVWSGSSLLKYWRDLERTQYISKDEISHRKVQKLKDLLSHAHESNAFYRMAFDDIGFNPREFKGLDDLAKLPILTKKDIRQRMDLLISDGYSRDLLCEARTGGSTGKPLYIYYTEDYSELRNASERRHDRWSGWEVGEPKALVWGNPHYPTGFKGILKMFLFSPLIFLDTMEISRKSIEKFAREWRKVNPSMLFGHAHSLFILAKSLIDFGIEEIKPKAIISSSMILMPTERAKIEEVFGMKVFNRYGCEEVGLIASECEYHDGMHINTENVHVEILNDDGSTAFPEYFGNLIITDLNNRAMPLIRYQIEDMGIPDIRTCPCGRNLPLLREVSGRLADFLLRKDGTKVAGISLIENTLTRYPGIEQMQIIQHDLVNMSLNIVRTDNFKDEIQKDLVSSLQSIFKSSLSVQCNFVSEIKPEQNRKYRFSICEIASQ